MLKDITLGQFFPGDTVAHRLDPRTKILLVVLYIVALFCAKSLLAYGILAAVLAVCVRISRVGIKSLVRGLKPVVFIIVFTGILNLFFTPGEHILAELGFLRISAEGLQHHEHAVDHGHVPDDLHHQPHQPHRRAGAPAGRIEKNPCAGP